MSHLYRMTDRIQRRFRSARPGSVLILVVALLVLMALLGTAFLSTARTDRYGAAMHANNTQIDLLMEGMVNQTTAAITQDLYSTIGGTKIYRPGDPAQQVQPNGYEHHDSIFFDLWLADRLPVVTNPEMASSADIANPNYPRFGGISFPLTFNDSSGTGYQFDRPDGGDPVDLPVGAVTPRAGYAFLPGAAPFLGQPAFPFMRVFRPGVPGFEEIPAADADGDGIADAGLSKIPIGSIDGITYYSALRIIDHNSAINVNTAMARNADYSGASGGSASPNVGFFTTGVGLAEMFKTFDPAGTTFTTRGTEFNALNSYRFRSTTSGTFVMPAGVAGDSGSGSPVADDGSTRGDFEFITLGDALYHQLGRRILNPGVSRAPPGGGPLDRFRPFGFADQAALAYRFGLINLDASPSPMEQLLIEATGGINDTTEDSLYKSAPNYASQFRQYTPNQVKAWYDEIADHRVEDPPAAPTEYLNRRTILTTRNPVANQMAAHGTLAGANLIPADPGMRPYSRNTGTTFLNDPLPPNPPRTNINTAQFPELWRGFWNVMAGPQTSTGPGTPPAGPGTPMHADLLELLAGPEVADPEVIFDPYHGQGFGDGTGTSTGTPPAQYTNQSAEQHPARMFRSSIRDPRAGTFDANNGARLTPRNQMLLRAAIAAVNAEDLRDSDFNVTARDITLPVTVDGEEAVATITVYGTELQPFITEVYVNTDNLTGDTTSPNPNGYIAIELTNPYDEDIVLGPAGGEPGWTCGMIDRRGPNQTAVPLPRTPGGAQLLITPLLVPSGLPTWRFPPGTVIPAGGKLLLENYDPVGDGLATENAATHRPADVILTSTALPETEAADDPATIYVPGLHRVLQGSATDPSNGGEFVLLRPLRADGVAEGEEINIDPSVALSNMVPVDQFDFTGATHPSGTAPPYLWMHYVRENGPGLEWRFVYPGRYDANQSLSLSAVAAAASEDSRHQGVQQHVMLAPKAPPTLIEKPILLLADDPVAPTAPYVSPFTIQIANTDFGGPNKVGAVTPNQFPFGTFARNGDILQVPFIGAYKIEFPTALGAVPGGILEMNSVSMDSVFAEDTDTANDPIVLPSVPADTGVQDREQIGRFYPIDRNIPHTPAGTIPTDDFHSTPGEYFNHPATPTDPLDPAYVPQWRYQWAADIFDYLTVQGPNEDFFPSISPLLYPAPDPTPVSNSGGTAGDTSETTPDDTNDHAEDAAGVDGLININTAGWRVLSMLPMVVDPATGAIDIARNNDLAKAIVYWRDVDGDGTAGAPLVPHGPFKTLYELNQVIDLRPGGDTTRGFRNSMARLDPLSPTEPGNNAGDISPADPLLTDGVRNDFEEKTLTLNRISDLVTTRSDMFTCYLLVQGWRDAGTPNASLVVQRRVAFIVDRSETTPTNPQAKVTYVPNN